MTLEEGQLPALNLALVVFRHWKDLELNPESLCYRLKIRMVADDDRNLDFPLAGLTASEDYRAPGSFDTKTAILGLHPSSGEPLRIRPTGDQSTEVSVSPPLSWKSWNVPFQACVVMVAFSVNVLVVVEDSSAMSVDELR